MGNIRNFALADDDIDDIGLFGEALRDIDPSISCLIARDGHQLMQTLSHKVELPQVIFLDVNMPEMNGWETLHAIMLVERIKSTPVILYSTSGSARLGKKAVESGALCLYEKPDDFSLLKDFLTSISASVDLKQTIVQLVQENRHRIFQ